MARLVCCTSLLRDIFVTLAVENVLGSRALLDVALLILLTNAHQLLKQLLLGELLAVDQLFHECVEHFNIVAIVALQLTIETAT